MRAGSIIHRTGDYQDIRVMGGLVQFMPLSIMCINLANLALCGTPFLAGFYSKDLILEMAFMNDLNWVCFWLLVLSTGLTVSYSFRLVALGAMGDYNLASVSGVSDDDRIITSPMIVLGVGALGGGCFLSWLIFPAPSMICMRFLFKTLALLVRILGGMVGYGLSKIVVRYRVVGSRGYYTESYLNSMWFLRFITVLVPVGKTLLAGYKYSRTIDLGWSEYYGGQGGYGVSIGLSKEMQLLQDNNIKIFMLLRLV